MEVEEGKREERSREEGRRGREYGLKRGREKKREAGILGEREIEERWVREGLEGRRAEEKGRRRGKWRPSGSTWSVEYHVTTGQKNGKGERRT